VLRKFTSDTCGKGFCIELRRTISPMNPPLVKFTLAEEQAMIFAIEDNPVAMDKACLAHSGRAGHKLGSPEASRTASRAA
jgi:hypothetical protein